MSTTFLATMSEAYVRQAIPELRTLDPKLSTGRPLAPGVIPFTTAADRSDFLARIQANEPIFVRHIHPVDATVPMNEVDAAAMALLVGAPAGTTVAVQVRAYGDAPDRAALRERLDGVVAALGLTPVTQHPAQVLSVTLDGPQALVGLSTPAENLSDWPGGEIRFRREEGQLSRAKFKLLEAFARFDIPVPVGGQALDLGAAPGGWTSLLLERGLRVTAVDTGELGAAIKDHPALTFLQRNVDQVTFPPGSLDLITCDMSWNPLHTARMVARLAPAARPGTHLVLTVKLMLENPTRTIRRVKEALEAEYRLLKTKQLFHNRDEVTMWCLRP